MQLFMWYKGGKHSKYDGNAIDTGADRLMFYDTLNSTLFDKETQSWYKNGAAMVPAYPVEFTLDDGRNLKANEEGGIVTWTLD